MDAKSRALLHKVLKDNGLSLTMQRQLLCDLLWQREPISMAELTILAHDAIDRTSLYRTVQLFERLGLVHRVHIGWKYKIELSDVFMHHHHHIVCIQCGKIAAVAEDAEIEQLITKLTVRYGFEPRDHQLEISGVCAECRLKDSRPELTNNRTPE